MKKAKRWIVSVMVVFVLSGIIGLGYSSAQIPKYKLRLQTHVPPEDTKRVMTKFIEMISAMSGGAIEISPFSVGAIVPVREVLDSVGKGTLDMAWYAEGYWWKTIPVTEIGGGLPFVFRDLEEARYFMWVKGFDALLREGYAKHNVHFIASEPYPIGLMTKKPIRKAEDLRGMKLRAFGPMADWLAKMKASTVFIPGGELYTALATGVVEGAHWGDAGPMYVQKFHEVLKNYMMPEPIVGAWNNLMINMDLWKKFTPEQKAMIETAAMGTTTFLSTNLTRMLSKRSLNEMVAKWNVNVVTLPEPEIEKMRKASLELQSEIAKKDPMCAKAMSMLHDFMKELGYEK